MPSPTPNPYTHRTERLRQLRTLVAWALVAGALALAGVYWVQRRKLPHPRAPVLGLEVQQSAAGVDIVKSVQGRPVFRVHAARANKLRAGGVDELHGVSIWVYDQSGRHADQIRGDAFRYDERSGELLAEGVVHIQLQDQVAISARGLRYNVKQGSGAITQGLTFAMGAAQGTAGQAALDSRTGVAAFSGGVELRWQRSTGQVLTLRSQTAALQRQSQGPDAAVIYLRGQARLALGTQQLAAPELAVHVRPDYSLRHVDATGGMVATSNAGSEALRITAQNGHADFTAARTQRLDHLELDGEVKAEQNYRTAGAAQLRRLQAGQMLLLFTPAGTLQELQARRGAALTETGGAGGTLAAPELDFSFRPENSGASRKLPALASIRSQGRTHLQRGPLAADADQVQLQLGPNQQPQRAWATGSVVARRQVNGETRIIRSQRLEIAFHADGTGPTQIARVQAGGGVVLQAGARRVAAQTLVYTPANGEAVFTGDVRGDDPQVAFRASSATWIHRTGGSSLLRAQGSLQRPVAISLRAPAGPRQATQAAMPLMPTSGQALAISAQSLVWAEPAGSAGVDAPTAAFRGTATFSGGVRLLQSPNLLRADQLTLQAGNSGTPPSLQARGHVQTEFITATAGAPRALAALAAATPAGRAVSIAAQQLSFSEADRQARYRGDVTLRLDATTLTAPQLTAWFAAGAGGLQRALASGGVAIQQPGRRAQAQQLSFDAARNQVQLTGGPPSIFDAEHGKITGDPLTFSLASDEIQVGGKPGTRVSGQTGGHN